MGVAVFSLMCGGDGLADIVGRRLGKTHKLPWNASKSWAGSGAMFLGGCPLGAPPLCKGILTTLLFEAVRCGLAAPTKTARRLFGHGMLWRLFHLLLLYIHGCSQLHS